MYYTNLELILFKTTLNSSGLVLSQDLKNY